MDVEFHYYMTYLIASRAGFPLDEARVIAYAAQFVDDNTRVFTVDSGGPNEFETNPSQTMDILKPRAFWTPIYTHFHFIPGDRGAGSPRKDGKAHDLCTTPGSKNANKVLDAAIETECLYRIGIACHSYADSWAHQNFIGTNDAFNAFKEPGMALVPNVGHADAGHNPDWAAHEWEDPRLVDPLIKNGQRFMGAARAMFLKLRAYRDGKSPSSATKTECEELVADLLGAIGAQTQNNRGIDARIEKYCRLAEKAEYGGAALAEYDEDEWLKVAIRFQNKGAGSAGDRVRQDAKWVWRNSDFKSSHWYRFQKAVEEHGIAAEELLSLA